MNFEPFLDFLKHERNYSPATVRAYSNDLALFAGFAKSDGIKRPNQINHGVVSAFIRSMQEQSIPRFGRVGLSDTTIARRLAALSSYMDYVRLTSDPKLTNPLKGLRRRHPKKEKVDAVDESSLEVLLAGVTVPRDRAIIALLIATGLRASELRQLDRNTISLEMEVDASGSERILGTGEVVGKGSKPRRFFVDEQTLTVYVEYVLTRHDDNPALFVSERKKRISVRAIEYMLSTWCRKLGLPHAHPHQLRHSFATRLANADINSFHLRELMGHRDFRTTLAYFKLSDQALAAGYFSAMEIYRRPPSKAAKEIA